VAVAVAEALKAAKLIFITTHEGILRKGHLIRQILVADLDSILANHKSELLPAMLSKAIHASAACKAGIQRVHIINGASMKACWRKCFQMKASAHWSMQ